MEKIIALLRVGDIWILVHISIKNYCTQFYRPKLDTKIKERDCILRISSFNEDFHMLY
jgi:hypothetical protein